MSYFKDPVHYICANVIIWLPFAIRKYHIFIYTHICNLNLLRDFWNWHWLISVMMGLRWKPLLTKSWVLSVGQWSCITVIYLLIILGSILHVIIVAGNYNRLFTTISTRFLHQGSVIISTCYSYSWCSIARYQIFILCKDNNNFISLGYISNKNIIPQRLYSPPAPHTNIQLIL